MGTRWLGSAASVLVLGACATTAAQQGGAKFLEVQAERPALGAEALYGVCFEPGAVGSVALTFRADGEVWFEARDGASNSTARCVREIAATYPHAPRPVGEVLVPAPKAPASGWAWLAWVKLLSAGRYGPERGLLDPAPLVASCLQQGAGLRTGATFRVDHVPALAVGVSAGGERLEAVTDTERCVEAVLGATAWPSTRAATLDLQGPGAPAPHGDVAGYFLPAGLGTPLEPARVREAMAAAQPLVGQCWDQARQRRAGLAGGRTVRFRLDATGAVAHAAVAGNASNAPQTAADYLLDACLLRAVRQAVRIPGADGGDSAYSWVFAERSE